MKQECCNLEGSGSARGADRGAVRGHRERKRWFDRLPFRFVLGLILPALVFLVWWAFQDRPIVPTIDDTFDIIFHPFRKLVIIEEHTFAGSIGVSVLRVALGFAIASATAIPLGLALGRWRFVRPIINPIVEFSRPICPIAWVPVAILIFKSGSIATFFWGDRYWEHAILQHMQYAMIAIIWWGAFFPILLNTADSVAGVKKLHIDAAKTLGASEWKMFRSVILPASLPGIVTGLRVGMGIAWMVIIAAEIFPGTRTGLGLLILTSHELAEYKYAFASIIMIGTIGVAINLALKLLSDRLSRWQALER